MPDNVFSDNAVSQLRELFDRVDAIERRRGVSEPRRIRVNRRWKCKTDAAHDKGDSGTVSVYSGEKGSETDTGRNIEDVYNTFGDIASGKWVFVEWIDGGFELYAAEC